MAKSANRCRQLSPGAQCMMLLLQEPEEEADEVCSELEMHEIAASLGVCPPAPGAAPSLAASS